MSQVYRDIQSGANYNIPPSLPSGLLYHIKKITNLSKQTLKIVPNNGQGDVYAGQKIIVTLPPNALVDLSTFKMNFLGYTQHNGTNCVNGPTGYCQSCFFPRNTASLIETLEIKINGQVRQSISNYGYIYNILNDFTTGTDSTNKNRIGQNADPSCKYYYSGSGVRHKCGYPVGLIADPKSANDQDYYTIRNWLGILGGNASTSIIDTSMYGDLTIEISLAPSGILMLGAATAAGGLAMMAAGASQISVAIPVAAAVGAPIVAEGSSYKLFNISFQITRYDLPKPVFEAMSAVLSSGAVYQLWYPNYMSFSGTQVAGDKTGVTRISLTTSSLEMLIGTFMVQNRDTQSQPILGDYTNHYVSGQAFGEYGNFATTFRGAIQSGEPICFNQSKYFIRNGTIIKQCSWGIGSVNFNYETINEQFNGVLRAFNSQNNTLGSLHEGLTGLASYQDRYYAHILSLNANAKNDIYSVSGLDASETPVQVTWEYQGGDTAANATFADIYSGATNTCTPVVIAVYSSHLDVLAGRNITTMI